MDLPESHRLNQLLAHVSKWSDAKSRAQDIINLHPLNQQLEVFLPTLKPGDVGKLAREESFFYTMRINPRELVDEWLSHPDRNMYAIVKNAPQDGGNSLCLFPSGTLEMIDNWLIHMQEI